VLVTHDSKNKLSREIRYPDEASAGTKAAGSRPRLPNCQSKPLLRAGFGPQNAFQLRSYPWTKWSFVTASSFFTRSLYPSEKS
jgi:hypothetical protein